MRNSKRMIALSLLGSAILFTATSAYSFPAPGVGSGSGSSSGRGGSSSTQSSSETGSEERDELAYKICFYNQPNFKDLSFCRKAPSRIGRVKAELRDTIKSIKISDSNGGLIAGPQVQLKVCDKTWRKGNCKMFNSSLRSLTIAFNRSLASYAFNVRR